MTHRHNGCYSLQLTDPGDTVEKTPELSLDPFCYLRMRRVCRRRRLSLRRQSRRERATIHGGVRG